ncbi:MAG: hypothetical protein V7676_05535 [Parasphingorhabdus sp.]|uniref:hypothetical protein n=1 Tax=Parasphingorhabdus sp. TaxID=2709688 RepID=UPI0030031220
MIRQEKRLLLLCNGSKQKTTGRLFTALSGKLSKKYSVEIHLRDFPSGILRKIPILIRTEFVNCIRVLKSDVLILHSALSLSLFTIIFARLTGRKVIAFIWDFYPASSRLMGNIRNPALLFLYGLTEKFAYSCVHILLVPTQDYERYPDIFHRNNVRLFPLWPCDPTIPIPNKELSTTELSIAFAGQINAIRGLTPTVQFLLNSTTKRIVLHIFSADPIADDLANFSKSHQRLDIIHHGFVKPEILQQKLSQMNFGLVSLDPNFRMPSFPSKIMAYLSAGIAVLYDGPKMPGLERVLSQNNIGLTAEQLTKLSQLQIECFLTEFPQARDRYFASIQMSWSEFDNFL